MSSASRDSSSGGDVKNDVGVRCASTVRKRLVYGEDGDVVRRLDLECDDLDELAWEMGELLNGDRGVGPGAAEILGGRAKGKWS
jgi:hypothetical protein